MSRLPRITVAGAGALGLTTALALADAGCEVAVFDPAGPEGNASSVAAGMLAPVFEAVLDPVSRDHLDLLIAARNLWPALEARLGLSIDRAGAAAVGGADFLARADAGMRALGLHSTLLPRGALAAMAPGLAEDFREGLLTREDWRIEPAGVLAALRRAAEAAGVLFLPRAAAGLEGAERLVIATGAGRGLASEPTSLVAIKGQLARVRTSVSPGLVLRTEGAYVAATPGGLVLGATMEEGRDDRLVEPEALAPLLAAGRRLFPEIAQAPFKGQAAVRAATPDGLPLAGRAGQPGVLMAVGARRNGWLLAPLVARIIVACVTEGEAGPYAARLDPMRFDEVWRGR
jgi:glycine oxidase